MIPTAAVDAVLAFLAAGGGANGAGRAKVLEALSPVVGSSEEGAQGLEDLARNDAALRGMGVAEDEARFDPAVVRGLEYYTGAVYEAELIAPGDARVSLGSVGGGGRYDDLVARFTGTPVPATGFSFGVSRLATALAQFDWLQGSVSETRGPVVVTVFDRELMGEYFAVASELRAAGIAAEVYLGSSGLKAQMKYADRRASPAAVIIGGDEAANGQATVKDLDLGRELASGVTDNAQWREGRPGQQTVARADLVETVRRIVEAAA
jgi:histidyl-tRNA synthetase